MSDRTEELALCARVADLTAERDTLAAENARLLGLVEYWQKEAGDLTVSLVDEVCQRDKLLPVFEAMRKALEKAEIFIRNGVAFSYIKLPSSDPSEYRDPALDTLPEIESALANAAKVAPKEPA